MAMNGPWCVIVNINTCHPRTWKSWQHKFIRSNIPHEIFLTGSLDSLRQIIETKIHEGHLFYLFAGGDGTLHQGGNLLLQLSKDPSKITIGVLPCGTGNDWLRSFGIHKSKIIHALQHISTKPLHVLRLVWPDGRERYAFNMVGGGLDALVVESLTLSFLRRAGKFKYAAGLIKSLLRSHTWDAYISVDQKILKGTWLTIQAGFGRYCGGGMYILPNSKDNSPALLLMRPKSLLRLIQSLPKLYNGKINNQPEAISLYFKKLEITHVDKPLPIEADGEWLGYSPIKIEPVMNVMKRLSMD